MRVRVSAEQPPNAEVRTFSVSRHMLALQQHPLLSITALALAAKVASTTLLKLASRLGPFDSSSEERWDTVYFLKIAREGYQYEQQAAFMPGLPVLMRTAGRFSDHNALLSGMVWSAIAGVGAALCLYKYVKSSGIV